MWYAGAENFRRTLRTRWLEPARAGLVAQPCETEPEPQAVGIAMREQARHGQPRAEVLSDRADFGICVAVLSESVAALVERRREVVVDRLHREMTEPEYRLSDFDSASPAMRNFMRMVRRVVEPVSSRLIMGDTSVGEERLARANHTASPRGSQPIILMPFPLYRGDLFVSDCDGGEQNHSEESS